MAQSVNMSGRRKAAVEDGSTYDLAKRAELVEIAGRQFKNSGFLATTLAEIGHKAGLDRATVYYYFGSKEELFRECLRVGVDDNINECERIANDPVLSTAERLRGVINQLMSAYDQHYPHMYVYIQEEMNRIAGEKSAWAQRSEEHTSELQSIMRLSY